MEKAIPCHRQKRRLYGEADQRIRSDYRSGYKNRKVGDWIMKKFLAVAVLMFASCGMSRAWNCSVAGEGRVQVPTSYTGNGTGDGNNQVVSQGGLNFGCLPDHIR